MATRVVLSEDAWAAVRVAYEDGDETVPRILKRFGIQRHHLYYRIERDDWRKRSEATRFRTAADVPPPETLRVAEPETAGATPFSETEKIRAAETQPAPPDAEEPAQTHEQRLERLHRIIDRLLARLESTMERNRRMTPQEQEKAARAITQTVTAIERVSELANTQGKVPETDGGQSHDSAEAERMRREIAERLERLSAKWLDGPDKPE